MAKDICLAFLFTLLISFPGRALGASTNTQEVEPAHILFLLSYHDGYSWEDDILKGFEEWGGEKADRPYIHVEWMDTKRFASPEYRQRYQLFLEEKYANYHFDLIATVDDNALKYVVQVAPWRDLPIVFSGINGEPETIVGERGKATGIAERFQVGRTLELALTLHPKTQRVIFITAADESGAGNRKTIDAAVAKLPAETKKGSTFEHWTPTSMDETDGDLAKLPENTILFALGSVPLVKNGRPLANEQLVAYVRARTRVAVYSDTDRSVGLGAAGGYVNSGLENGRLMVNMARRIFAGEAPESIPVVFETPQVLMLDFNELKRFGVSERSLPADAEVLNRPPSIFDPEHRAKLIGFISAILILILVLSVLVMRGRLKFLKVQQERARELQIANEALEKAKIVAEDANRAKSVFFANMSHELRTPLNAILGFSEMIERDSTIVAATREKVVIINRAGTHLLSMINDVLDLSKIEAGKTTVEPEIFDLPVLIGDVGRMFEARAKTAHLLFSIELAADLPRHVFVDGKKLRQVLINLLGNAVKFTKEGGFALLVQTQPVASDPTLLRLQLTVTDTGPGIPSDQFLNIFKPFFQIDGTRGALKGTGLGLSISQSLVELMGGQIGVESTLGQGSRFWVDLPVSLADMEQAAVEPVVLEVHGLAPDQPRWRMLVVDDNLENRLLLVDLLRTTGFEVREATNGQEGVDLFAQWQPHFIWMDMRMPIMDGYEATRRIRALPHGDGVKIVALTASAFQEQRPDILAVGCNDIVHKPYRQQEIFDAMANYLGVNYSYREVRPENATPSMMPESELREAIVQLAPEIRNELYQALLRVDQERFDEALLTLDPQKLGVVFTLKQLSSDFQFDALLKLFTQVEGQ